MKKIITILLTLLMVVSLGTVVFAQDEQQPSTTVNVKIKNDKGWISTSPTEDWTKELSVTQNTTIYLKADSYGDGKLIFNKWVIDNPNVDISGPDSNGIYSFVASGDCEIEQKGKYSYETNVKYYVRNVYVSKDWSWDNVENFEHYTSITLAKDTTSHEAVYIYSPKNNLVFPDQDSFNVSDYELAASLIRVNEYSNSDIGSVIEPVNEADNTGREPKDYIFTNHMMGGGEISYYFSGSRKDVLVTFVYTKKLPEGYQVVMNGDNCTAKVNGNIVDKVKENETLEISAPNTIEVDGQNLVFSHWYCYLEKRGPYYNFDVRQSTTTVKGINDKATFYPIYKNEAHTTTEFKSATYYDGVIGSDNYSTIKYAIGGDKAGVGVKDRVLISNDGKNTSYKLQKLELVGIDIDNKEVLLKSYSQEGMPLISEVKGYYKMYQDNTLIPDGYKTIVYKEYYVSNAGLNKTSSQILANSNIVFEGTPNKSTLNEVVPTADIAKPTEDDFKAIVSKFDDGTDDVAKITDYYDLSLVAASKNNESYKIKETGDAVEFTIYLSDSQVEGLKGNSDIKVARVHEGETTMIPAKLDGNKLTFSTDKFSTYAVVAYEELKIEGGNSESESKYKDLIQSDVLAFNNKDFSEFSYLSVKPLGTAKADADNSIVEMSFDVTPIDENGNKVSSLNSPINFRLPVDKDADFTYANVTHKGEFLKQYEIQTDANGNKYVEVSSDTFSVFGYALTNTKYVAPSINNPVNITRKPVVNTSAK